MESFEDEHLAQAESVAFEQLMASGRNLRSFKKDPDLMNAKSSVFDPEIELESSELKDCPSVRELLAKISDSNRVWVEGNDWAFRTAERMLEVLGLSFEEFAQTQKDAALIKYLKQLGVVQRSGKRVSRKQNGEMEWLITPPAFGLIRTKFFQYVDAYLKRPRLEAPEEVDVLADEFKAKRELMKVEFGADGRGKMHATEMALLSIKSTFKAQLNATGQSLILDAKALGEAAASREAPASLACRFLSSTHGPSMSGVRLRSLAPEVKASRPSKQAKLICPCRSSTTAKKAVIRARMV